MRIWDKDKGEACLICVLKPHKSGRPELRGFSAPAVISKSLVDPLRGLVCGQDEYGDQDQAEQQRVEILFRKQFLEHIDLNGIHTYANHPTRR